MNKQTIFKSSCWTCQRAKKDPQEEYLCPQWKEHWQHWANQEWYDKKRS